VPGVTGANVIKDSPVMALTAQVSKYWLLKLDNRRKLFIIFLIEQ